MHASLAGVRVFHLLGFYKKLHMWSQLKKLILSFRFEEVAPVYPIAGNCGTGMPNELVLFRFGVIILGVSKSWCSAADSTGRIPTEQYLM